MRDITFRSADGRQWRVAFVGVGERYGRDVDGIPVIVCDTPLVEFYDIGANEEFVSRYPVGTFLDLRTGVRVCHKTPRNIDTGSVRLIQGWICGVMGVDRIETKPLVSVEDKRASLRAGSRVWFVGRKSIRYEGVIVRVNDKTATVECTDGTSWRVSFGILNTLEAA